MPEIFHSDHEKSRKENPDPFGRIQAIRDWVADYSGLIAFYGLLVIAAIAGKVKDACADTNLIPEVPAITEQLSPTVLELMKSRHLFGIVEELEQILEQLRRENAEIKKEIEKDRIALASSSLEGAEQRKALLQSTLTLIAQYEQRRKEFEDELQRLISVGGLTTDDPLLQIIEAKIQEIDQRLRSLHDDL